MTDSNQCDVEFWIAINEEGEFAVSKDGAQDAQEELNSTDNCQTIQVYALSLAVTKPKVVAVAATLPDTDGKVTVTVT